MNRARRLFRAASLIGTIGLIILLGGYLGWIYRAAETDAQNTFSILSLYLGIWLGAAFLFVSAILFIIASMQGEKSS